MERMVRHDPGICRAVYSEHAALFPTFAQVSADGPDGFIAHRRGVCLARLGVENPPDGVDTALKPVTVELIDELVSGKRDAAKDLSNLFRW